MAEPSSTQSVSDEKQRQFADRRRHGWRTFVYGFTHARRRGARRDIDEQGMQSIDIHGPYIFGLAMLIMFLCICDSYFTLQLISHGAVEANPFMDYFLQIDIMLFYSVKYIITAAGVMFVISLKRFKLFRLVRGSHILVMTAMIYITLISYQLGMLSEIAM